MDIISLYNDLANRVWERMIALVGIHTVQILITRSLWITRQKFLEAEAIEVTDTGIRFDQLAEVEPQRTKIILEEFFSSLVDILARLVGQDITSKLTREIDVLLKEVCD